MQGLYDLKKVDPVKEKNANIMPTHKNATVNPRLKERKIKHEEQSPGYCILRDQGVRVARPS